ncbi:ADP-ribose pyrophosphatase YjhB, NUDIX family [Paenibacillus uliginis N3/975]|uniref:ADP-ribose pyrophosphatase YjhB, NUDIX family n=1 Tax=Paenibacillus uliginis N3/975 TaxID=1313296 RepID=A0A1X7H767_9BACL|nr:ADP-ribose pyrophosphatase YjhB, NUDIX family [Paenibacillus uliginis N3/975]
MEKYTHLGVYGVLIKDGRILLIRKARGPYLGKWDLPGGSIEFGEEPEQTLKREFHEETGLTAIRGIMKTAVSCTIIYQRTEDELEEMHHIGIIYQVELEDDKAPIKREGDQQDSLGAEWIPLEKLKFIPITPFVEMMMEQLFTEGDHEQ